MPGVLVELLTVAAAADVDVAELDSAAGALVVDAGTLDDELDPLADVDDSELDDDEAELDDDELDALDDGGVDADDDAGLDAEVDSGLDGGGVDELVSPGRGRCRMLAAGAGVVTAGAGAVVGAVVVWRFWRPGSTTVVC